MFPIEIASTEFFLLTVVAIVAYHAIWNRTYRQIVLILASLPLIASFLHSTGQICFLLANVVAGYLVAYRLQRRPSLPLLSTALVLLGLCFLMHKDLLFPGSLGPVDPFQPAAVMGYSLVFFKLIHLLIDAHQAALRPLRPLTYLCWLLAFFTWLAGPIARYNDFASQLEEGPLSPPQHQIFPALNRIVNGLFRLVIICPFLRPYLTADAILQATSGPLALGQALIYLYGYYLFIYMNFCGYCDLVIPLGQLFGLRIPENFRRPYTARNLLDYWRLWHITLSEWFRDYLFTPIFFTISRRLSRQQWYLPLIAAYLVTFLCTGLWHGCTIGFMLFGLTHALGCLTLRFSWPLLQHRLPRHWLAAYKTSRLVTGIAIVCTHTYVAISLLFFAHPLDELHLILCKLLSYT